ncbi:MAG TPA: solute carrier family 23 protein [Candidatus Binatia bacterium]
MAKKPANLIYGLDESPSLATTLLLGLQHILALCSAFVYPVIVLQETGMLPEQAERMIHASMIVMGIATILQTLRYGRIGSGYLCPEQVGPAYVPVSILAVKTGGLPLLAGMTLVSGLFGIVLSRLMGRLRPFFSAEVTGTIVMMVGLALIPVAVSRFLGIKESGGVIDPLSASIASITLFVMVGVTVWCSSRLRLFGVLIGIGAGSICAYASGLVTDEHLRRLEQASLLALPSFPGEGWSFSGALLVPFLVTALASSLKVVGDLTTCQKVNDAEWKRPDMKSISGGILADACGVMLSGGVGTMGQSTSSANVGLSIATGATSRRIGFACGGILIVLAFVPKLAVLFVIMPSPVIGALLFFAASFVIVAGVQILTSRMMDARKTFVVGVSIVLGLSVDMLPRAYYSVPAMLLPAFTSSLSVATLSAVLLNVLFRIGIAQRAKLQIDPRADSSEQIFSFMENQGGVWGARREVIDRAKAAMNEFIEAARALELSTGKIDAEVSFDEFNLDVDMRYDGELMEFPIKRPTEADLLEDERAVAKLAGFLIRNYVDRIKSDRINGRWRVQFHLEH